MNKADFSFRYWYQNGCLAPDLISMFMAVDPCVKENGGLQVRIYIFIFFSVWLFPKYLHELKYNSYVTLTTLEMDIEDTSFFLFFCANLFFHFRNV